MEYEIIKQTFYDLGSVISSTMVDHPSVSSYYKKYFYVPNMNAYVGLISKQEWPNDNLYLLKIDATTFQVTEELITGSISENINYAVEFYYDKSQDRFLFFRTRRYL